MKVVKEFKNEDFNLLTLQQVKEIIAEVMSIILRKSIVFL